MTKAQNARSKRKAASSTTDGTASWSLAYDADNHQIAVGPVPLSARLRELVEVMDLFLLRLEGGGRGESGGYVVPKPRAGGVCGVRILWDRVSLNATIIRACLSVAVGSPVTGAGGVSRSVYSRTKGGAAIDESLSAIAFAILQNTDGSWTGEIDQEIVDKVRRLRQEADLYRERCERNEGLPPAIGVNARAIEHVVHREIARHGSRAALHSTPPSPPMPIPLTGDEKGLLLFFDDHPHERFTRNYLKEEGVVTRNPETMGNLLKSLRDKGLVDRPTQNKGSGITPKGREIAASVRPPAQPRR